MNRFYASLKYLQSRWSLNLLILLLHVNKIKESAVAFKVVVSLVTTMAPTLVALSNSQPLFALYNTSWFRWTSVTLGTAAAARGTNRLLLEQDKQILFGGERDDDRSLCLAILDMMIRVFGDIDCMNPKTYLTKQSSIPTLPHSLGY